MIRISRRTALAGLAAVLASPRPSFAAWPERPISIVHGFAPGGGADITARHIGDQLSRRLGQPVLIESKSGAGSRLRPRKWRARRPTATR